MYAKGKDYLKNSEKNNSRPYEIYLSKNKAKKAKE